MNTRFKTLALAAVTASLLVGCNGGGGGATDPGASTAAVTPSGSDLTGGGRSTGGGSGDLKLAALPGTPVQGVADPAVAFKSEERVVASRYGGPRSDPFALKGPEKAFEIEQNTNRLLGTMGSWTVMYTPEPEKEPEAGLISDPQPYRRLSGIIVGDSVYALLDSGDGSPVIVRPGMKVPNSEWTVVSIDTEKAILRRPGNRTPRQITVRLESPPAGMGGNQGGNPGFGPNGPGGGGGSPQRGPGMGGPAGGGGGGNRGGGGGGVGDIG